MKISSKNKIKKFLKKKNQLLFISKNKLYITSIINNLIIFAFITTHL